MFTFPPKQAIKKLKKIDADEYIHVGDEDSDEEFAKNAGFKFLKPPRLIELFFNSKALNPEFDITG